MTQTTKSDLVTKGEAQRALKISRTKLDLLIERNNISLTHDPMDLRLRLVDLTELKRILHKPAE